MFHMGYNPLISPMINSFVVCRLHCNTPPSPFYLHCFVSIASSTSLSQHLHLSLFPLCLELIFHCETSLVFNFNCIVQLHCFFNFTTMCHQLHCVIPLCCYLSFMNKTLLNFLVAILIALQTWLNALFSCVFRHILFTIYENYVSKHEIVIHMSIFVPIP